MTTIKTSMLWRKWFTYLQVWTENADGTGAVNFITGMGGFLQSLLFGYGGFRLRPDRIDFHGRLPPSTSSFNITGLDYLGGSIDFYFTKDTTIVRLTKAAEFTLTLKYEEKAFTLKQNEIQMFSSTKASIVPDLPLTLDRNSANHVLFSSVLLIISALFCSKLYICWKFIFVEDDASKNIYKLNTLYFCWLICNILFSLGKTCINKHIYIIFG